MRNDLPIIGLVSLGSASDQVTKVCFASLWWQLCRWWVCCCCLPSVQLSLLRRESYIPSCNREMFTQSHQLGLLSPRQQGRRRHSLSLAGASRAKPTHFHTQYLTTNQSPAYLITAACSTFILVWQFFFDKFSRRVFVLSSALPGAENIQISIFAMWGIKWYEVVGFALTTRVSLFTNCRKARTVSYI